MGRAGQTGGPSREAAVSRIVMQRQPVRRVTKAAKRRALRQQAKAWRADQPRLCPLCDKREAREEHHIIRKGMGGNLAAECDENRMLICDWCHDAIHEEKLPLKCVLAIKRLLGPWDHALLEAIAGHALPDPGNMMTET